MLALLHSALFPESDPTELAAIARELGFDGVDLVVRGTPGGDDARTLALLAADAMPALLLTVESCEPDQLHLWAHLAADAGCRALRLPLLLEWTDEPAVALAGWSALARATGVPLLLANHAGSRLPDPQTLAELLAATDPTQVAALLAPDQIPRSRAGDHAAWVARVPLPPVGGVALAGYRWESEVAAGNVLLWAPTPTLIGQGLTPWAAWVQRLRELDFDGPFTFGDASLPANAADRLRFARDDLRWLRRNWAGR